MTRTLILLALLSCLCAASDLKQSRAGRARYTKIANELYEEFIDSLVNGVREIGSIARMVSALSSALEILMFVILKNVVETSIPAQIFNLLQLGIYLYIG